MGLSEQFNSIIRRAKPLANCAVLTGYELGLSTFAKKGSDVWLNNPSMYREASGTSGMTAAFNCSINLSLPDGWVPEFAIDQQNCFVIKPAGEGLSGEETDNREAKNLMDTLENIILPMYYNDPANWHKIIRKAAADIVPAFDSGRMVNEYYEKLYN